MKKLLLATTMLCALASGAYAAILDHGLTYTVTSAGLNTTDATINIHITGINGATDDQGLRQDVNAFAFGNANLLTGLSGLSPTFGTFQTGGLDAGGCNGTGNFFCFTSFLPLSTTTLPANSTMDIAFSLHVTSGNFLAWATSDPHFKIDWTGGFTNNYSLVSQGGSGVCDPAVISACPQVSVPGPVVGALVPSMAAAFGMLGFNYFRRRRRLTA